MRTGDGVTRGYSKSAQQADDMQDRKGAVSAQEFAPKMYSYIFSSHDIQPSRHVTFGGYCSFREDPRTEQYDCHTKKEKAKQDMKCISTIHAVTDQYLIIPYSESNRSMLYYHDQRCPHNT